MAEQEWRRSSRVHGRLSTLRQTMTPPFARNDHG